MRLTLPWNELQVGKRSVIALVTREREVFDPWKLSLMNADHFSAYCGAPSCPSSTSGTDAFTLVEATDCWEALETVIDRRRKVVSDRCARDEDLIERGTWAELQRVIVTD